MNFKQQSTKTELKSPKRRTETRQFPKFSAGTREAMSRALDADKGVYHFLCYNVDLTLHSWAM